MSSRSSSAAGWSTRLGPAAPPDDLARRPDDPRLGEVTEFWRGDPGAIRPGRAVLVGFPQDEGVRRNHGRPGAAAAPREIRRWLYRLTPWDGASDTDLTSLPPLDLGDVRVGDDVQESQEMLAAVVAAVLERGGVPVVLGGGHETAYGHFLGYAARGLRAGLINLDAHLDVRPFKPGHGHSGSSFRQALEHASRPLYACLGAQPHSTSRDHFLYARRQGCSVYWAAEIASRLEECFARECDRMAAAGCAVMVSLDADVVGAAEVPGVSAPNVAGLSGEEVRRCVRRAGLSPQVASFDLVE
ncbi:MAG TPA: formimidoylglutamase, partial [Gemmataceae bacterium]|nr:formimidoylglutamase [Gemmataceae bacterium]